MNWPGEFWRRITNLFRRERFDRDLDEEMRLHKDLREREQREAGLGGDEARYAAQRRFGNELKLREESRDMWGWNWLEDMFQDIHFGLRTLRKNPGFTTVAVLTLALGIGANTAVFSGINSVLLKQLPFRDPDRLVVLHRGESSSIPYAEFLDLKSQSSSFEYLALHRREPFNLTGAGDPERVPVRMVSAEFFRILDMRPILGRVFDPGEDRLGADPVVVLSEGLWRRKFGADAGIITKSVTLSGRNYSVIGVVPLLPSQFAATDVFAPIGQWDEPAFRKRGAGFGSVGLARLKPGTSLEGAMADLKQVASNTARAYPKEDLEISFTAVSFRDSIQGDIPRTLYLLLGAGGFILLIACANVANLLLAKSTRRTREIAIRVAMGAGRGRVIRQLLTETVLLALTGGGLGLLVAVWGARAISAKVPVADFVGADGVQLDLRVLGFTLLLSVLTGVLFGLTPALKIAGLDLLQAFREGGRGTTGGHRRTQSILVVSEVALAMVLLVGAGLLVRSLTQVLLVDPGFNPKNTLVFSVALSPDKSSNPQKTRQMFQQLTDRLERLPGADSAAVMMGNLPLTGDSDIPFWREDKPAPENESKMPDALWYAVGPDYFRAMGISLVHGRFLTPQDAEGAAPVAVIDTQMARSLFAGEDPIGKRLRLIFFDEVVEIVGVAGDVKQYGLDAKTSADQFQIYIAFQQVPDRLMPLLTKNSSVVLRTLVPPTGMISGVRQEVKAVDGEQVMYGERTMEDLLDSSLAFRRSSMIMLEILASLALALACIGIYGVISYLMGQRTQEIGIRMALGAQRRDVLWMVLRAGMRLELLGVAFGIAAALPLMRVLSSMLFGVTPADPLTFAAVGVLLTLVALAACLVPARRATKVDPMIALRYE